ncbi:unnamed protein product [Acanthoscelides obtectus]|uniref:Uncharacterized protein n=1 Tax=Acanthoscelides obtectus TaxID=200917 RepID=A0A9P0L2G6_ACAOB|nr:unnamed protein product [Acanthoscelides obtectus]CAK1620178.1 hypothetical protein AOBTE_LOCUS230 [Acanthoscelides obtectus]
MNWYKRLMILVTFFVSCAAMALLVAALGTKHWTDARAKRAKNPAESDGKIHFGLFEGKKELNVAYGWRTYEMDVIQLLRSEPEFLIYGFWLGTVVSVCAGLLFSTLSAIFAAVNTATTTSRCLAKVNGLYVWNFFAVFFDLLALCFWLGQFFMSIQYNVLSREDRENEWTSEDMAEFGYSFWFVAGAAIASFVNIIIIVIANMEKEETIVPVLEEKTNGAIMLY